MLQQDGKGRNAASGGGRAKPALLPNGHLVIRVIEAAAAAHGAIGRWLERHRTRRALAALDEHQLRDIGLTRAQALAESRRWWLRCYQSRRALARLDDSRLADLSEIGRQVRREARRALAADALHRHR